MAEKMRLYGFNNLTKSLSFNIYDICYAKTAREQQDYIKYINEQYNSERLTEILSKLTNMIGATVLNISKQDYEPQGASVTFLIAEESMIFAILWNFSGSFFRIHRSFGAVNPAKAMLPVSSVSRALPIVLLRYSTSLPVRPSFHRMAGRMTLSSLSSATSPCI